MIDHYKLTNEPINKQKTLLMPPKIAENIEQVRFYLEESRGISHGSINKFLENDLLYANSFSSVVFVHRDLTGHINGASWRDTTPLSNLRGNTPGTDSEKGYFYIGNPNSATRFVLTEAPIDLLSYYEIETINGVDLSKTAIFSLGGKSSTTDLLEHLSRRQITLAEASIPLEIIYATDDTRSGEKAFDRFLEKFAEIAPDLFADETDELAEKVNIIRQIPPKGKDWNEYLKLLNEKGEFPTLEEIKEHLLERENDPPESIEISKTNEIALNLLPVGKEASISQTNLGEKTREENFNETRDKRIENGITATGLAGDGNELSGGIDSRSVQTGEDGRNSGNALSNDGGESGENLSGSLEQGFESLGGVRTGESGDQTRAGSGGLGNQLIDEKVYQFKIRREGDEFLQYRVGLNEKGEWQTFASGLIGSKDQSAKKTQFINLAAETFSSEKQASLTQAVREINSQLEILDNSENEYAPLYREIYQFHRDFLAFFTPQIEPAKVFIPSEIRSIYQNEHGFKVVFNDQKYTRSFTFRDEDGNILDSESVREKAKIWRNKCDQRESIINSQAEYVTEPENYLLFSEGTNRLQAGIIFDEFDNLWRGAVSGEIISGVHQFRLSDKPITLLHQGFDTREELLSNLILKTSDKLENRINLISKIGETKMFQTALDALELKSNEILGVEGENNNEDRESITTLDQAESQTILFESRHQSAQDVSFHRRENGEIEIRNIGKIKRNGLTVLELAAFDESLLKPVQDYLENGENNSRLWFANEEDILQPQISLSDLPTAENQLVILPKINNSFALNEQYSLPVLRRINLSAARDAESRTFELETDATAIQKIKGEIFYASLLKETSERLHQNLFSLLEETEQLQVLIEIENRLKISGFDSIANRTKDNGREMNHLRVFAGNWSSIGQLIGNNLEIVPNSEESIASQIEFQFVKLTDGLRVEIGDYTLSQIFRYDGNLAARSGVNSDVQAWTVYLSGSNEQLETLRKSALEELKIDLQFESLTDERELNYARSLNKKPFELSSEEYVAQREFKAILNIQSEINSLREQNADLINLEKPNFRQRQELKQNELLLNQYFQKLEKGEVVTDLDRNSFAEEYLIAVNRAIKKGLVTTSRREELANINPLFKRSVENRNRVERGQTIAYRKETDALDYSLQVEIGATIRRQDNQLLSVDQKQQIKETVAQLETVFGNLKEVFVKGEISIIHTNGKQPVPTLHENELFVGVKTTDFENRTFVYQFAQWLDKQAQAQLENERAYSFSEGKKNALQLNNSPLIKEAWRLSQKQITNASSTLPELSINNPSDIFARLVEQYSNVQQKNQNEEVGNDPSGTFRLWSTEKFAQLIPEIEAELNKKLLLVEKRLQIENLQKFGEFQPIYQENILPEIDLVSYERATSEDRNYFTDENNFSPEEVRLDYFQETYALADSVLYLTDAVKATPTSKSGERELKKNLEKLQFDQENLSFHVFQTGKYFGQASEEYLKRELFLQKNLEFNENYELILERPERISLDSEILSNEENSYRAANFQGEFEEVFGNQEKYQLRSYRHHGTVEGIPPLDGLQITRDEKAIYIITPNERGDWRLESVRDENGKPTFQLLINGMERIKKVFQNCADLEELQLDKDSLKSPIIENNETFAARLQERLGSGFSVEAGVETDEVNADIYSVDQLFSVYPHGGETQVFVYEYDAGDFYTPPDWNQLYSVTYPSLDEALLRIKAKTVFDEKAFQQQLIAELKGNNLELLFNPELNPDRDEAQANFEQQINTLIESRKDYDYRYQFLKTDEINRLFLELESENIQSNIEVESEEVNNLPFPVNYPTEESQAISKLESLTEAIKATGHSKREFIEENNLSGQMLYNLEFRVMDFETIPQELISKIAQAVKIEDSVLEDYLQKPNAGLPIEKLTFSEAVQEDEGLRKELKEYYLGLLNPKSESPQDLSEDPQIKTLDFDYTDDFHRSYTPELGFSKQTLSGKITAIMFKPGANHDYGGIIPNGKPSNDVFYTLSVQTNEFPNFEHRIIFDGSQQGDALELIKNNTLTIGSEINFTAYVSDALEKRIQAKGSGALPTNVLSISYLEKELELKKKVENTNDIAGSQTIESLAPASIERAERKSLLLPDVFDLSSSEQEAYQQIAVQLDFHGFETLQLSSKTIALKTVPANYEEGENPPRELVLEFIRNPHLLTEISNLSITENNQVVVNDTQNSVNQKMKELLKLPLAKRVLVINSPSEYISLFEAEALVESGATGIGTVKGYDVEMDADWINSNVARIELNNVSTMLAEDILSLTRENLVDKLEIIRDGEQIFYFDPVEEDKKLVASLNAEEARQAEIETSAEEIREILFDDLAFTERQRTGFFAAFLNSKIEEKFDSENLSAAPLYEADCAEELLERDVTELALRVTGPLDDANLIVLFHPDQTISVVEEKSYSPEALTAFLEKKTGSFLDEDSWKEFQKLEQAVDYIAESAVERFVRDNEKEVISEVKNEVEEIDANPPSIEKQSIKWGSKILPDHLLNQMPVRQKRETVDDYEVYAKLFHPLSSWTLFVTEAEAVRDETDKIVDVNLFGFVHTDGINDEWGYSSLREIDETTVRGLKTERDLYFDRGRFADVWRQFRKERGMFVEEEQPAKDLSEIGEIVETKTNSPIEKQKELLLESIEITFSESPDIEEGKYFLSVEDFDEFLAKATPPERSELYYKTDFTAIFSDGSRFDGKFDLQFGQTFTMEQIISEDLESAKTILSDFANTASDQNVLQERITLNENFLKAINLQNKSNSRQFVDVSQFLPEEITQHLEGNRPFSISRRNSANSRIQVQRFIADNQNSLLVSQSQPDGTEKQVVFAYDQENEQFFFDKLLTSQRGRIIDKSSNILEAQEIINSIALKDTEKQVVKPTLNQYRITDLELHDSGLKTKFRNNVDAIKLLRQIEEENRLATAEEQETLAKFSGWGGLKNAFDVYQPKEDWKNEIKELQILLADNDEYFAARQSTENAHYTSAEFAGEMWKIAEKLGFTGGRVLEPAVGDGIFIGTMPEDLSASTKVIAVEKEAYSARLTKQLYQRSEVINTGFEKTNLKENSFDLVISNFPFGSYTVHDPAYNSMSPSIHDYFFLKSLDKVKDGGLVVALTSRFTMDKTDSSIREALARRAELVAAFRLPETAFQDNAHTSVVTDLLIFQKRPKGQEIGKDEIEKLNWIKSDFLQLDDETYHNVNQYFHDNPNNIWGTTSSEGRMYGRNELTVKSEKKDDYLKLVAAAIENLEPVFTSTPVEIDESEEKGLVFADSQDKKLGSIFISESKAYRITNDGAAQLYLTPKEQEKMAALIDVRETIKSIYKIEIENGDAEEQRAELNHQYDAFKQKYGIINRPDNLRLLEGDPEIYLVKTLESYFDVKTGRAEKAEVFYQSTLRGYEKPESAENITQALAISLNETGKVELERIGELLSATSETVVNELKAENRAFLNPTTKEWDLAEKYLSGNVRQKLSEVTEIASMSAENEELYRQNIEELTKVQPKDLDYLEIEPVIGAPWIPKSDVKDFLLHLTKADESAIRVENAAATGQWAVSWFGNASSKSAKQKDQVTKIWGTNRADTIKIVQAALDGRPLHITDTHSDGDKKITVTNVAETELANQKLMEVKQEFKDWIWSDSARRTRLHRDYNDNYNNFVERKYDGSHLTLPNSNPNITLRPHQKDAVWRAMQEPTTYFGHEVGAGKTD